MSNTFVVWFVIAVFLSWAMGAYNRLVRLRARGLLTFAALEDLLSKYPLLIKGSLSDKEEELEKTAVACEKLVAATDALTAALRIAHTQPLNGLKTMVVGQALDALAESWCEVKDLPSDLGESALPSALPTQWEALAMQVEIARLEFNRAVMNYNESRDQFPAILLAWVFGFKPAQPV
jgi:LemA protein